MCLTGGGMVAHQERRHAQQEGLRQVGQMAMAGSDGSKMTRWSAAAATPRSGRTAGEVPQQAARTVVAPWRCEEGVDLGRRGV